MRCRSRRRASGHLSSLRTRRLLPYGTLLPAPATDWNCTPCLRTATASCQPCRISQHVCILFKIHSFLRSPFNDTMHGIHGIFLLFSYFFFFRLFVCVLKKKPTGPNTPGRFIVWFRNETTLLVLWQPPYPAGIYSNYKVCTSFRYDILLLFFLLVYSKKMINCGCVFVLGFHRPSRCCGEHFGSRKSRRTAWTSPSSILRPIARFGFVFLFAFSLVLFLSLFWLLINLILFFESFCFATVQGGTTTYRCRQ